MHRIGKGDIGTGENPEMQLTRIAT